MQKDMQQQDISVCDDLSSPGTALRCMRRADLKTRLVDGELVVLDRDGEMVHQLNQTASYIWERCDGESTAAKIAGEICHDFEIEYSAALIDVLNTIEQFEKLKLLNDA